MGSHPLNLTIRFLLEVIALLAIGYWGWNQYDDWQRFVLAFGLPIILAIVWGTFAVPNDPSRSGKAPIVTPGIIRLVIEIVFFSIGTWAIYNLGYTISAWVFGLIVAIHYILSYDRIKWLIKH